MIRLLLLDCRILVWLKLVTRLSCIIILLLLKWLILEILGLPKLLLIQVVNFINGSFFFDPWLNTLDKVYSVK